MPSTSLPAQALPVETAPSHTRPSRAGQAACLLLGLLLPVSVMSYRAIPLFVGCIVALLVASGDWRHVFRRAWTRLDTRLALVLGAFLAWAAVSLAWTLQPGPAAGVLALVIAFVGAGVLAWAADPRMSKDLLTLSMSCGLAIASALVVVEIASDMALHKWLGGTSNPSKMNQAAIFLLLWLWPVVLLMSNCYGRSAGLVLTVLAGAAIMLSESDTARLAFLVALLAFALVRIGLRILPALIGLGVALVIAASPWFAAMLQQDLPPAILTLFKSGHAAERVTIWTSFAYASGLKPFVGFGFNASGLIGFGPLINRFPEVLWTGIRDSHPHNMFLQTWVELGGVGAALLGLTLLRIGTLATAVARPVAPFAAAIFAAAPVIALVGHGAWQTWWIAALCLLPMLVRLAGAPDHA